MSTLTDAVRGVLGGESDIHAAAVDVKNLVCAELARVDPAATIRRTDYFNHSYVPDIVAEWPGEPAREVFLRFMPSNAAAITDDLQRIGRDGPVIIDLSTATAPDEHSEAVVVAAEPVAQFTRVLVTDTEATEHIRPGDAKDLIERLITSNVLRAGRGQLTEDRAEDVVRVSRAGFDGANTQDEESVRDTLTVARSVLVPELEHRLEKSLQLVWWAGGGDAADFPGTFIDDMKLDPADTRDFLLSLLKPNPDNDPKAPTTTDDAFWDRLAERLNFEMIAGLGDVDFSVNLDRLMTRMSTRIALSHAALDRRPRPMEPADRIRWAVFDNFIVLYGPEWVCRFTPHGRRFNHRGDDQGGPITLQAAYKRFENLPTEAIEVAAADERMIRIRRTDGHQTGGTLADLAREFDETASVLSVVVALGTRITADFRRMVLGSTGEPLMRTMAGLAPRLLTALDTDERGSLDAFLSGKPAPTAAEKADADSDATDDDLKSAPLPEVEVEDY